MNSIRVLIVDLPGVLADVMTQLLESRDDIALVGRSSADQVMDTASRTRPDVVIVGLADANLPAKAELLLRQLPSLRVLGVTRDRGQGFLYEMLPHRTPLGELSPEGLISAIRAGADPGGEGWTPWVRR